jgi:hypothetical protein
VRPDFLLHIFCAYWKFPYESFTYELIAALLTILSTVFVKNAEVIQERRGSHGTNLEKPAFKRGKHATAKFLCVDRKRL